MQLKDFYDATLEAKQTLMSQRCTTFNFFLILAGLMVNAIITCIKEDIILVALILSIVLVIIAILFSLLEKRNTVYYADYYVKLREYEGKIKSSNADLKDINLPFTSQLKTRNGIKFRHTIGYAKFFLLIFLLFVIVGLILSVLSILTLANINLF